jgi:hypothetical protein
MGSKIGSALKGLMEDMVMWYGYGGCTTRREESRGSIEDELEEEYYGGDGQD